jgi:phasin
MHSRGAKKPLRETMSLVKGNSAVNESVQKENVNGTAHHSGPNGFAWPGVAGSLAEQGVARAQERCAEIKAASGQIADAWRETYSANAGGATSYGLKVIDISSANTAAAMDFFVQLLGSKSPSDVFAVSAAHARKTFDATSTQNWELWELTQKLATQAGEPVRKSVARIFQTQS